MSQTMQRVLLGLVAVIALGVVILVFVILRPPPPTESQMRGTERAVFQTIDAGLSR
jgi:hypothetical protein